MKSNGFECLTLSELIAKPKDHDIFRPHRLTFNWIFFITEGSVNHMLDFKTYQLKKNDCLVVSSNQIQAFDPSSEYTGYAFLFTNNYLQESIVHTSFFKITSLFNYHISSPNYSVDFDLIADSKNILSEFRQAKYTLENEIIGSLFTAILLKLYSLKIEHLNIITDNRFHIFNQFSSLVAKEFYQSRNVNTYIKQLNVSHKHLNEVCKRFTAKTSKEFIDYFIILEIKRKLKATTSSIKSICYECGFDEPTNFHKYFKRHTGLSPIEFRTNNEG